MRDEYVKLRYLPCRTREILKHERTYAKKDSKKAKTSPSSCITPSGGSSTAQLCLLLPGTAVHAANDKTF